MRRVIIALSAVLVGAKPLPLQSPVKFQANTSVTVIMTDQATIDAFCGRPPIGWRKIACAEHLSRTIVAPNPCKFKHEQYAAIMCHELAHIQGWKHKDPWGA